MGISVFSCLKLTAKNLEEEILEGGEILKLLHVGKKRSRACKDTDIVPVVETILIISRKIGLVRGKCFAFTTTAKTTKRGQKK